MIKKALVPLLAVFSVKIMLGGGNLTLSLKELFITVLVATFISIVAVKTIKQRPDY